MRGRRWTVWVVVGLLIAATGVLVLWLADVRPSALESRSNQIRLTALVLILALVASGLFRRGTHLPVSNWLRHGAVWIAVGLVLVLGYSFRSDIVALWHRLQAELIPGRVVETAPGTVMVRAGDDGHFRIDALVDGTPLELLVDTGATLVTLSLRDARKIGLDKDRLVFSQPFRTATGTELGALVRLHEIRVGPITVRNVDAMVNRAPMGASLLGQSFLNRLRGYAVSDGSLTMRH